MYCPVFLVYLSVVPSADDFHRHRDKKLSRTQDCLLI